MAKNRISQLQIRDEQQPVRLCFPPLPLCAACSGHATVCLRAAHGWDDGLLAMRPAAAAQ